MQESAGCALQGDRVQVCAHHMCWRLAMTHSGWRYTYVLGALSVMFTVAAACGGGENGSPTAPSQVDPSQSPGTFSGRDATSQSVAYPSGVGIGQGIITFPPRTEPNAFFNDLQALYRDVLRREQVGSFVDSEGVNVWLTEYFRFYLNGCSHVESIARTLTEVRSGGSRPVCGSERLTFPPRDLPKEFFDRLVAVYRDELRRSQVVTHLVLTSVLPRGILGPTGSVFVVIRSLGTFSQNGDKASGQKLPGHRDLAGLSFGTGIGLVMGAAMDNVGLGIALGPGIGLAFGVAFGVAMSQKNRSDE